MREVWMQPCHLCGRPTAYVDRNKVGDIVPACRRSCGPFPGNTPALGAPQPNKEEPR